MRDLVPSVQFKNMKNTHGGVFLRLQPATLLKVTLLGGCSSSFLNCAFGTKSNLVTKSINVFTGRWNSGSCYNAAQLLPSFCSCEGNVIATYTKYSMQGLLQEKIAATIFSCKIEFKRRAFCMKQAYNFVNKD